MRSVPASISGLRGKLLLAFGSGAFALLLAEAVLPHLLTLEKVSISYDPLLGFRGRPELTTVWRREMGRGERVVRTNSEGFHDRERSRARSPGTHRVVFLGDSYLEAYQVEIDSNFAQQLAWSLSQRAESSGFAVESLNQGIHGYGLGVHYLYVRERLAEWRPDTVVLVLFLGNDLHDNYTPLASSAVPRFDLGADGELRFQPPPPYELKTWLRDHVLARSTVTRLFWMHVIKRSEGALELARTAGMVSTPRVEADSQHSLQQMTALADHLLRDMADRLAAVQIELLVYVIPDPLRVNDLLDMERYRLDPNAPVPMFRKDKEFLEVGLLNALRAAGTAFVYPLDEFKTRIAAGEMIYRNGYGHFTQLGHDLSARLLEAPLEAAIARAIQKKS